MPRTRISDEIRQKVIEAGANGLSPRELAEKFGISISSVRRILKEKHTKSTSDGMSKNKAQTERQRKIKDIERRIAELEEKILVADRKTKSSQDVLA